MPRCAFLTTEGLDPDYVYDDLAGGPAYDAVYVTATDMSSALAIGNQVGNGQDGETWTVVQ